MNTSENNSKNQEKYQGILNSYPPGFWSQFHPDHILDLAKSGLTEQTILKANFYSIPPNKLEQLVDRLQNVDQGEKKKLESGLAFLYPDKDFLRIKFFPPLKTKDGKTMRYSQSPGTSAHLYIPPGVEEHLKNPEVTLYWTEGEKKGLRMWQEEIPCVALGGLWNWLKKEDIEFSLPLRELGKIAHADREEIIVPDSDFLANENLLQAVYALGKELEDRGARVKIVVVPQVGTEKVAVDDLPLGRVKELLDTFKVVNLKNGAFGKVKEWYRGWKKRKFAVVSLEDEDPRKVVEAIRGSSLKVHEKRDRVSIVVIRELKQKGFFIHSDVNQYFYFYDRHKKVYPLTDPSFSILTNYLFGVNESDPEWEHLLCDLRTETFLNGTKTEIYKFAYYNKNGGLLYVSRFDGQVYRLDGQVITLIPNGSEGILFLDSDEFETFQYLGSHSEKYLKPLIINRVNFVKGEGVNLSEGQQKLIYHLWLYSLFFESILKTKPILLLIGPQGAGKTYTVKTLGQILFGRRFDTSSLRADKEDSFIATITHNYFAAFDNADERIQWLNDRLAVTATGGAIRLRKLYTTNELEVHYPKCFIALTSMNPQFRRPDVADRLLILRVERIENFISEDLLYNEILGKRNEFWTELLNDLNEIVASIRVGLARFSSSFRMADWATLAWNIAQIKGTEKSFEKILRLMSKEVSEFVLENDPLFLALEAWLGGPANQGKGMEAKSLFSELKTVAEAHDFPWPFKNSVSFGKRFNNIMGNLRSFFDIQVGGSEKHRTYSFRKKE